MKNSSHGKAAVIIIVMTSEDETSTYQLKSISTNYRLNGILLNIPGAYSKFELTNNSSMPVFKKEENRMAFITF